MTRQRIVIISAMTGLVMFFMLFSKYGLVTRLTMASDLDGLEATVVTLRATEDSLRSVVRVLEKDTLMLERIARERYGFVRPGEDVYIIRRDSSE